MSYEKSSNSKVENLNSKTFEFIIYSPLLSTATFEATGLQPESLLYIIYTSLVSMIVYFLILISSINIKNLTRKTRQEILPFTRVSIYSIFCQFVVFFYSFDISISSRLIMFGHFLCGVIITLYISILLFSIIHLKKNKNHDKQNKIKR